MVAYNFQAQFADAVAARTKRQTIRADRASRHARVGEPVQLYTGMRTKNCHKLVSPDPPCAKVVSVMISTSAFFVDGNERLDHDAFAQADGFKDYDHMSQWFEKTHGLPFYGWLIAW